MYLVDPVEPSVAENSKPWFCKYSITSASENPLLSTDVISPLSLHPDKANITIIHEIKTITFFHIITSLLFLI